MKTLKNNEPLSVTSFRVSDKMNTQLEFIALTETKKTGTKYSKGDIIRHFLEEGAKKYIRRMK